MLAGNASGLTHLDLGLLAGPRDDKADATLDPEDDQDDDSEEERDDGSGQEREDDSEEEHDDYEQEPWALHSPHWLQGDHLPAPLSSLTHLHLIKPYTGATLMSMLGNFRRTPDRYDAATYAEWCALLDSAAGTLKEAVFEHRVALDVGDTVGRRRSAPAGRGPQGARPGRRVPLRGRPAPSSGRRPGAVPPACSAWRSAGFAPGRSRRSRRRSAARRFPAWETCLETRSGCGRPFRAARSSCSNLRIRCMCTPAISFKIGPTIGMRPGRMLGMDCCTMNRFTMTTAGGLDRIGGWVVRG